MFQESKRRLINILMHAGKTRARGGRRGGGGGGGGSEGAAIRNTLTFGADYNIGSTSSCFGCTLLAHSYMDFRNYTRNCTENNHMKQWTTLACKGQNFSVYCPSPSSEVDNAAGTQKATLMADNNNNQLSTCMCVA